MIQSPSFTRVLRDSPRTLIAAVIAVGLLAGASRARAVTLTWTNNSNDSWTSTTAWQTNLVSGFTNDVTGGTNVLISCVGDLSIYPGASPTNNVISCGPGGTGGFPGIISSVNADQARFTNTMSYTVTVPNNIGLSVVIFTNTAGTVTLNAGASTLTVTGRVRVADGNATSTVVWAGGTLSVANGNLATTEIGSAHSNSVGILMVTNGTVIMERNVSLGTDTSVGKLIISGPGVVTNSTSVIPADNFNFAVRSVGSQLIITNGGKLFWCGGGETRANSNSLMLVSGPGSLLYGSNIVGVSSTIACGTQIGPGSLLIVSNGATIYSDGTFSVGRNGGSSNTGLVVGAGSKVITSPNGNMTVGVGSAGGWSNTLSVYNGGYIECGGSFFSVPGGTCTNSTFLMGGVGAMSTGLAVAVRGNSQGVNSLIIISNAVFNCTKMSVLGSGGNVLTVLAKGTLNANIPDASETNGVTVGAVGGSLVINGGTLNAVSGTNGILITVGGSGTLTGNSLIITNGGQLFADAIRVRSTNSIVFSSGTISVGGMDVDSGANGGNQFVIGNGTDSAYYDMTGNGDGFHTFGSPGLVVTNGASIRGSGTLAGTTTILGTFVPGFANSVGSIFTSNSLSFGDFAILNYDLGTSSDSVTVNANLDLGGTLNITDAGGFGPGDYTLFTYFGSLSTGGTLTVGSTPNGGFTYIIDTNTAGVVILHVTGVSSPYSAWASHYGLAGGNAAGTADPDGDGMINTNEFLAGFNPANPQAYLHVISIVRTNGNADIRVTYLGANGDNTYSGGPASRTNVLEFATGTNNGSYTTNNFASTGQTNILSGGNGLGVITNMVDVGGATNKPSRYYRIRVLLP